MALQLRKPPAFTVAEKASDTHGVTHLEILSDNAFLVADFGTSPSIANLFGEGSSTRNSVRFRLLQSLDAPVAWVFAAKVKRSARGSGLGTALFAHAFELFLQRGIRYVALSPAPEREEDEERLLRFYQRLGFSEIRSFHGESLYTPLMLLDLHA